MEFSRYTEDVGADVLKTDRVLIVTALSSLAMSVLALSIFTLAGFFPVGILPLIWTFGIRQDIAMGTIGGIIGIKVARRIVRSNLHCGKKIE